MTRIENTKSDFPTRFNELIQDNYGNQKEFLEEYHKYLKKIGKWKEGYFSDGMITKYKKGEHNPDYIKFKCIADFFGVSYDYLLGESTAKKRENIDIAKELGLSEGVIEMLAFLNEDNAYPSDSFLLIDLFDLFLSGFEYPRIDDPNKTDYTSFDTILELVTMYISRLHSKEMYSETIREKVFDSDNSHDSIKSELVVNEITDYMLFETRSSEMFILEMANKYFRRFLEEAYRRFKDRVPNLSLQEEIRSKLYQNDREKKILSEFIDSLQSDSNADAE